ncbi:uncharacterized protein B0P05DRAFT_639385 [Gilbertella persicaria]|uniref:uncharacterized protein n=1 Tax=Gilbertella persicaria TaxID=101096 RepID=UPI00221FE5E0|nr:uncharacterized protein B0P05DRAFT_639385 [Gilbertella persicaria]KAI8069849.1 hypothetical protein B0P05DRAFT_639385 [Gilbertella persicaria]
MTRQYYCDFCQCSFPDNPTNRYNHQQGQIHIQNRKLHYDWYKDPHVFIQEQLDKPPCHYYYQSGYCEYGLLCRYSHITFNPSTGHIVYPPEIIHWFKLHPQDTITSNSKRKRYRLPSGWKVKDLPPSLKPPPSKYGYDWQSIGHWESS